MCVGSLVVACRTFNCSVWICFLDLGSDPGPLNWECGVLATGPPGKSLRGVLLISFSGCLQYVQIQQVSLVDRVSQDLTD